MTSPSRAILSRPSQSAKSSRLPTSTRLNLSNLHQPQINNQTAATLQPTISEKHNSEAEAPEQAMTEAKHTKLNGAPSAGMTVTEVSPGVASEDNDEERAVEGDMDLDEEEPELELVSGLDFDTEEEILENLKAAISLTEYFESINVPAGSVAEEI